MHLRPTVRSTLADAPLNPSPGSGGDMASSARFASYDEFFTFYLKQHSDPRNRRMHAIGTTLGIAVVIAAFATGHPWYALLFFPVGYGCAWFGHFVLEKNKPATFGHPFWSFISDFRMLGLMFTGRLEARIQAEAPRS
jgi:hypothetical protein